MQIAPGTSSAVPCKHSNRLVEISAEVQEEMIQLACGGVPNNDSSRRENSSFLQGGEHVTPDVRRLGAPRIRSTELQHTGVNAGWAVNFQPMGKGILNS
jgi:hypothetical protein